MMSAEADLAEEGASGVPSAPSDHVTAQVIRDDPDLTITHYPGSTDTAVVAFTGIGHGMGAIQQPEFVGSARGAGKHHVISVIDRNRTWYSAPGIQRRVIRTVHDLRYSLGLDRLICLGNSMGGFGALLFAERLGADTTIAFGPQYSMRLDFGEVRWAEFRKFMDESGLSTLGFHLTGRTRAHVIYGADDPWDRQHVQRIKRHCSAQIHEVVGCGHDVTFILRKQGLLGPLISALIEGDMSEAARILEPETETRTAVR